MYACDRCGARFHSARAASLQLCPRCLLRDDAASHLHWAPPVSAEERRREGESRAREASPDRGRSGGEPADEEER
ncbi:MAG: zinc finger domain-containing protein [Solirubrobacterales bacterium]